MRACIFDLDGVIVDTAKYHYLAWKRLANELGFDFTEEDNERLKGVSRMRSLEILLEIGGKELTAADMEKSAAKKNEWYVEYIEKLEPEEILPGVSAFLTELRGKGIKTALGSASKNAPLILERLKLNSYFDAVIDGTKVSNAKPDPEVFLKGAQELGIEPESCIVFEDAQAGIDAARNGNMFCVGVGAPENLNGWDHLIPGFANVTFEEIVNKLKLVNLK
ncbi:MAG: beta-phosphoglucomutase [Bacteroidales bacterium]|nr:beta-phosphoglucomutase [Bacteroidales bacterium]MBN2818018.1 beta-phosphoglucomutase [Bacteroidales bacterium]